MALEYRTTVSVVFWTETTDDAQDEIDALTAALPDSVQDSVLSVIQYAPEGPPASAPDPETVG